MQPFKTCKLCYLSANHSLGCCIENSILSLLYATFGRIQKVTFVTTHFADNTDIAVQRFEQSDKDGFMLVTATSRCLKYCN
ncbi:hypothetical protein PA25_13910 [Pseudoalteromonas sp. A25]|nr:hypothetical protein PA25_13910 [Pseudoalteromonas sp. A25]